MCATLSPATTDAELARPNPPRVQPRPLPLTSPFFQSLARFQAPSWLQERIAALGEPSPRQQEQWKNIRLQPLLQQPCPSPKMTPAADASLLSGVMDVHALPLSEPSSLLETQPIDALQSWATACDDVMALAALTHCDGVQTLRLPANTSLAKPLYWALPLADSGSFPVLKLCLEAGSEATVVLDAFAAPSLQSALLSGIVKSELAADAKLTLVLLTRAGEADTVLWHTEAHLAQAAQLSVSSVIVSGGCVRHAVRATLAGEGADATLNGLALPNNRMQQHQQVQLTHAVPRCTSQQLYKSVVQNAARSEFDACITVAEHAIETDAQQLCNNVLLSDKALVWVRPWLKIDADDVACSHGATVGQLNPEELFYLQSRGLDADSAQRLLVHAFAYTTLAPLVRTQPTLGAWLAALVDARLETLCDTTCEIRCGNQCSTTC